ncbi:MAG: hypothetical protein L3K04_02675 [Thermoplasmata archaeon]|nr:hypothetical protein [Thermoplasmata archaeon]MCI4341376.1 hypothetical protein [Thermoplasmata archaeon]
MDPTSIPIQAILFALFAILTAALAAVIGPTYDNLFVPSMQAAALFPSLPPDPSGAGGFLAVAAAFSQYLVVSLVDPALVLVVLAVGLLYLVRATIPSIAPRLQGLFPRLVVGALLANFTLPVASALFGLASATYPVVAGFDGGAWQRWSNLGGFGLLSFSWDNGILAFVFAFVLLSVVLLLVAAIAVRNALLGVLLVLLPVFTLLWPVPALAPLARRGWLWFAELAFLPCVLVVPLELAVGSGSIVLLLGYLIAALASPAFLSLAGQSLTAAGMPGAGGVLAGGIQRGLASAGSGLESVLRPLGSVARGGSWAAPVAGAVRGASAAGPALALPVLAGSLLGSGGSRLLAHFAPAKPRSAPSPRIPPMRGAGR